jgi:hypothetical protein
MRPCEATSAGTIVAAMRKPEYRGFGRPRVQWNGFGRSGQEAARLEPNYLRARIVRRVRPLGSAVTGHSAGVGSSVRADCTNKPLLAHGGVLAGRR